MKVYECKNCHNQLYFENSFCLQCQHAVGFDASTLSMITLNRDTNIQYSDTHNSKQQYKYCQNAVHSVCNWLVPANSFDVFCLACGLNRTIPTLFSLDNVKKWKRIEIAKHRLIYSMLRLQLPIKRKETPTEPGIAFDFLQDAPFEAKVTTGHDNGVITLNILEADDAERVKHQLDLGERYRTLLGHFRHEIGHYYWDVLIKNTSNLKQFRKLFGDESIDYAAALQNYYANGQSLSWADNYISPYAKSHAWEDWAESWAHYLHMMDTLETAYAFGINIEPKKAKDEVLKARISQDPYCIEDFETIVKMWLPLTFAVNSINRSMGYDDFYPFVISLSVTEKLKFIHQVCWSERVCEV